MTCTKYAAQWRDWASDSEGGYVFIICPSWFLWWRRRREVEKDIQEKFLKAVIKSRANGLTLITLMTFVFFVPLFNRKISRQNYQLSPALKFFIFLSVCHVCHIVDFSLLLVSFLTLPQTTTWASLIVSLSVDMCNQEKTIQNTRWDVIFGSDLKEHLRLNCLLWVISPLLVWSKSLFHKRPLRTLYLSSRPSFKLQLQHWADSLAGLQTCVSIWEPSKQNLELSAELVMSDPAHCSWANMNSFTYGDSGLKEIYFSLFFYLEFKHHSR